MASGRASAEQAVDAIAVDVALSALPPRERQALALRYLDGEDERTTAARMNVSQGAVRRYCADGRKHIGALLG